MFTMFNGCHGIDSWLWIFQNKIHFSFHKAGAVCSLIKLKFSMKLYARVNYELLTMRIYFIYFMKEILKIHHLINVGEVYLKFMKQTMFHFLL